MQKHPSPIPTETTKADPKKLKLVAPRILTLLKGEGGLIILGTASLLFGSAINLTLPYIIKIHVNTLTQTTGAILEDSGKTFIFSLILLFIVQGIIFYFRHYLIQTLGLKIVNKLKTELFKSTIYQEVAFFDASKVGDLLSRITSDTEAVQRGISINTSVVLRYSIQILGGIILMVLISPLLTFYVVLTIPLIATLSIFWSKKLKKLSKKLQEELGESSVIAEEALTSIKVVKIFGTELFEISKFIETNLKVLDTAKNRTKIAAIFSSMMSSILNCAVALIIYLGLLEVSSGNMSSGDLTAFILYCVIVAVSFGFLSNAWAELVQSAGSAERIYEIIDRKSEVSSITNLTQNKKKIQGSSFNIEFKSVSFHYETRPDVKIIDNLTFSIPAEKTIALVGPSGGGKSTIASLIPRLYDPTTGEIYFDGINTKELDLRDLRGMIAYVPQQPQLFSGSILENISYGNKDISEDRLLEIVKLSALEELVKKSPYGLQTIIGDKGIQLSGGERQRVAIARAFLRNPKLLILDEATSSLDSENEKIIQNALEVLCKNRTTLIIAHRLSTVQNASQVIVIKDGQILEQGTHTELISKHGAYKSLIDHQLLKA